MKCSEKSIGIVGSSAEYRSGKERWAQVRLAADAGQAFPGCGLTMLGFALQ